MLLDGEATALTRKAVELALAGDQAALRLCLDRTVITRRERAVELALPSIRGSDDIDASDFENRLRQLEESHAASREDTAALRHNWAARFDSSLRRD